MLFNLLQNIFGNMKRVANDKAKHNNKTGATLKKLSAVDEVMLDYEGRDSVYMVGLQNPDNPPVLPNQDGSDSDESMDDIMTQAVDIEDQASVHMFRVPVRNPPVLASQSLPGKMLTLIKISIFFYCSIKSFIESKFMLQT